jgi:hypothetical protein
MRPGQGAHRVPRSGLVASGTVSPGAAATRRVDPQGTAAWNRVFGG